MFGGQQASLRTGSANVLRPPFRAATRLTPSPAQPPDPTQSRRKLCAQASLSPPATLQRTAPPLPATPSLAGLQRSSTIEKTMKTTLKALAPPADRQAPAALPCLAAVIPEAAAVLATCTILRPVTGTTTAAACTTTQIRSCGMIPTASSGPRTTPLPGGTSQCPLARRRRGSKLRNKRQRSRRRRRVCRRQRRCSRQSKCQLVSVQAAMKAQRHQRHQQRQRRCRTLRRRCPRRQRSSQQQQHRRRLCPHQQQRRR